MSMQIFEKNFKKNWGVTICHWVTKHLKLHQFWFKSVHQP